MAVRSAFEGDTTMGEGAGGEVAEVIGTSSAACGCARTTGDRRPSPGTHFDERMGWTLADMKRFVPMPDRSARPQWLKVP
jgi:hypothetical protein